MSAGVLVVGGGQAAAQVAQSLREGGYPAPILVVGEEASAPYQRPPLSKAYLAGEADRESLLLRDPSYYAEQSITVLTDERVEQVVLHEEGGGRAITSKGQDLSFEYLILATGADARPLSLPGFDADIVHCLRNLDDADRLAASLARAHEVVVVGGGFIGLEAAAVARVRSCRVTVLETADRLLGRATPPQISSHVESHHRDRGMDIRTGARVVGLEERDGRQIVTLEGDVALPADLVVVGIGAVPRTELAERLGAAVDGGIVVDTLAQTTLPGVYAIGDCTNGGHVDFPGRMESVQNAIDQAKTCATTILGSEEPYATVPFFWSDQADLHLQMAGTITPGDELVVRAGDDDLAVLAFRGDTFRGIATINRPRDFLVGRRALDRGLGIDRMRVRDANIRLRDLLVG